MDTIGYLIFFGLLIAHFFVVPMDHVTFLGACLGLGLCAIAGAINRFTDRRK